MSFQRCTQEPQGSCGPLGVDLGLQMSEVWKGGGAPKPSPLTPAPHKQPVFLFLFYVLFWVIFCLGKSPVLNKEFRDNGNG